VNEEKFQFQFKGDEKSIADNLRDIADQIEGGEQPDTCVLITGGSGQMVVVQSMGELRDTENAIATMEKAKHIIMRIVVDQCFVPVTETKS
jgi:hypothetical protein